MVAVIDNGPVTLSSEGHVFHILFSAVWGAEGADDPSRFVEVGLSYERFNHFMAPAGVRLNDLLTDEGLAFRLLRTVVPPLLRGAM